MVKQARTRSAVAGGGGGGVGGVWVWGGWGKYDRGRRGGARFLRQDLPDSSVDAVHSLRRIPAGRRGRV